ncbi:MAG TPA: RsmG family class I SAM-dependent methyltransferase [Acidobacteriaceae bacterium]|jgi:16S rRNA (guanine527-N7)-methyltransferase
MPITAAQVEEAATRWGLSTITAPVADRLAAYGNLLLHWNTRLSLTAIHDEAELIERHLMEGVFAAAHHPAATTGLDFGSGTGVPGIPIALCRPEIHVTLAESQRRKAAFLQEALRMLQLSASVHPSRAELLPVGSFDAVWMRAVDRSASMLPPAASLVAPAGTLCLLATSNPPIGPMIESWQWKTLPLPCSRDRVLHIGRRP